jgi:hypothetical protein
MANVCLIRWLVVVTASVFLAEMVGSNSVQQTEIEKQAFLKSLVDAKRQPVRSPKQTKFDGSVFGGIHDNAELPQSLENVRDNLYNLDFTLENVDLTKLSTNNGGTVVFACQQVKSIFHVVDFGFLGLVFIFFFMYGAHARVCMLCVLVCDTYIHIYMYIYMYICI